MTGLPTEFQWKDPKWTDPDKVLTEFAYDGTPVSQVARDLRDKYFTDQFDVLLPEGWGGPNAQGYDWLKTPIHLKLKQATASEVFNAMNLFFENNQTPLRWELKMNGRRRIALLRVSAYPMAPFEPQKAEPNRMIFFVGDMVDDEKRGGMTMLEISKTVRELVGESYDPVSEPFSVQVHEGAQLFIVKGTEKQIDFMRQALEALRRKAAWQARKRVAADAQSTQTRTNRLEEPK